MEVGDWVESGLVTLVAMVISSQPGSRHWLCWCLSPKTAVAFLDLVVG